MIYTDDCRLRSPHEWVARRYRTCRIEQVANARRPTANLTPLSQVPAETVRAGWAALLPNQTVPLIWERVFPDPDDL